MPAPASLDTRLALSLLLLGACQAASPAPADPPQPNVVLVSLDTVRWDHTSLSGYARDTTPSLAELAALPGATTFTRAYAPAAWSLPSYASILTGRDALSHGVGFLQDTLDPGQATLAEALSAYGCHRGLHLRPAPRPLNRPVPGLRLL